MLFEAYTGLRTAEILKWGADKFGMTTADGRFVHVWRCKGQHSVNPYVANHEGLQGLLAAHAKWKTEYYPDSPCFFPGHDREANQPVHKSARRFAAPGQSPDAEPKATTVGEVIHRYHPAWKGSDIRRPPNGSAKKSLDDPEAKGRMGSQERCINVLGIAREHLTFTRSWRQGVVGCRMWTRSARASTFNKGIPLSRPFQVTSFAFASALTETAAASDPAGSPSHSFPASFTASSPSLGQAVTRFAAVTPSAGNDLSNCLATLEARSHRSQF